jgi:hypothetical protein
MPSRNSIRTELKDLYRLLFHFVQSWFDLQASLATNEPSMTRSLFSDFKFEERGDVSNIKLRRWLSHISWLTLWDMLVQIMCQIWYTGYISPKELPREKTSPTEIGCHCHWTSIVIRNESVWKRASDVTLLFVARKMHFSGSARPCPK